MSTMPQFLDANGLNKYHQEAVEKKVDKVEGKGLSTNDFTNEYKNIIDTTKSEFETYRRDNDLVVTNISALVESAAYKGYVDEELAKKVDKVDGKSLVADSEIERLSKVNNYDDTLIMAAISQKADNVDLDKKVNKVEGYSLVADSEIARLKGLYNYDDTLIKENINKKANSDDLIKVSQQLTEKADASKLDDKVDKSVVDEMYTNEQIDTLINDVRTYADENNITYKIKYENESNQTPRITLTSSDGEVQYIDVTDFIKDGMIESVELVEKDDEPGQFIKITWNADGGSNITYINVSSLVDVYAADNSTLSLNDYVFSIKDGGVSTAKIADKAITEAKLDKVVTEKLNIVKSGSKVGAGIIAGDSGSYAAGEYSLAQGYYAHAGGNYAHAEGNGTYTTAEAAHAEGYRTYAQGVAAHSEGNQTYAKGSQSHAEGYMTKAVGQYAHSEGANTIAYGSSSHTEGKNTTTMGIGTHIEGQSFYIALDDYKQYIIDNNLINLDSNSDEFTSAVIARANTELGAVELEKVWKAHEEATQNKAKEYRFSLARGEYSHVEGENNLAFGRASHAEGQMNITRAAFAHTEGIGSEAFGVQSHAEGSDTVTFARASHTEGKSTVSNGFISHAEGIMTQTGGDLAVGSFDPTSIARDDKTANYIPATIIEDSETSFIIQIESGKSLAKNFYTVVGSSVLVKNTNQGTCVVSKVLAYDATTKQITLLPNIAGMRGVANQSIRIFDLHTGTRSDKFNSFNIIESIEGSPISKIKVTGTTEHGTWKNLNSKDFIGDESSELLIGNNKNANYFYTARILSADWKDNGTELVIDRNIQAILDEINKLASATNAGLRLYVAKTELGGQHSEGYKTWAKGIASHAEGNSTIALADYSHAGGIGTIANEEGVTVVGTYNKNSKDRDFDSKALFVVGNGKDSAHRSDAFVVYEDGRVFAPKSLRWANEKWFVIGDSITGAPKITGDIRPAGTWKVSGTNTIDFELADSEARTPTTVSNKITGSVLLKDGTYKNFIGKSDNKLYFEDDTVLGTISERSVQFTHADLATTDEALKTNTLLYPWTTHVNGKRYFEVVADNTGINIKDNYKQDPTTIDYNALTTGDLRYAKGGTGFKQEKDGEDCYWKVALRDLPADEENSNVFTIFASGNDCEYINGSTIGSITDNLNIDTSAFEISDADGKITYDSTFKNTYCGCINTLINIIYEKQPFARICLVTSTPWSGRTPDQANNSLQQIADIIVEIAHLRGVPCLDLYHNSDLRVNDKKFVDKAFCEATSPVAHLNGFGHRLIAPKFKAMLETILL